MGLIGECSIWELLLLLLHNTFILIILEMCFENVIRQWVYASFSSSLWATTHIKINVESIIAASTHTHTAGEHVEEAKEDSGRAGWQCHAMPCPPHHQHPNHALFHAAIMPRMMPLTMSWGRRTTPCTNKVSHILRLHNFEEGQPPLCKLHDAWGRACILRSCGSHKRKRNGVPVDWWDPTQPTSPHPFFICSLIFLIFFPTHFPSVMK